MSTALEQGSIDIAAAPVFVVPNQPVMTLGDAAELRHPETDAAQAVAAYRRVLDAEYEPSEVILDDSLATLSIDDLRQLACDLHVPERSRITEKAELIAEIRRRF